jgi:hypothetical protein
MRSLATIVIAAMAASCSSADAADQRRLEDAFSRSDTVLYGVVVGSGHGACGTGKGETPFHLLRVTTVIKGRLPKGDTKVCGKSPMEMSNWYIVSGKRVRKELVYEADAVLMPSSRGRVYRLISSRSPVFDTGRGKAFGVAILEPDFEARFRATFKSSLPGP